MKTDLLPVTAGDEEYCLPRLRRRYSAEKYRMSKDCSQGTSNWCIGISFVFFDRWCELIQEVMNT